MSGENWGTLGIEGCPAIQMYRGVILRRNRDIAVHRELPPVTQPRSVRVGDVIRDKLFPLAINVVLSFDGLRVRLDGNDSCFIGHLDSFEHADVAQIDGVDA